MLGQQPGLQCCQGEVRVGCDMARQGRFLRRCQLAWPVATPRAGADFSGATTPDQRLVDVRHADPEHRGRRPRRHAAVNRHQNPRPQVLRIALTLSPSHRRPNILWSRQRITLSLAWESPFGRFRRDPRILRRGGDLLSAAADGRRHALERLIAAGNLPQRYDLTCDTNTTYFADTSTPSSSAASCC